MDFSILPETLSKLVCSLRFSGKILFFVKESMTQNVKNHRNRGGSRVKTKKS